MAKETIGAFDAKGTSRRNRKVEHERAIDLDGPSVDIPGRLGRVSLVKNPLGEGFILQFKLTRKDSSKSS